MILTALLLFAAQSPDALAPAAKPVPDPDKTICRREMVTGSNMPRKVCHTRAEWTRQMRENGGAAERLRGPNGVQPQR
jgi:hypothetical protein